MSVELKPGYWKNRRGDIRLVVGRNVHASEDNGHAWLAADLNGMPVSFSSDGYAFGDKTESEFDLVTYLGPTLPPDLGDGYRLLHGGEKHAAGDEECVGRGCREWTPIRESQIGLSHHEHGYAVRRRIAPTLPPPDGYELCPDGTLIEESFLRYSTHPACCEWHNSEPDGWANKSERSGKQDQEVFVWYARPIEKWEPTGRYRGTVRMYSHFDARASEVEFDFENPLRELRCGDKTKWEPVQ